MTTPDRRDFLQRSGLTVAGSVLLAQEAWAQERRRSASERLNLALIGCGGRGTGLLKTFAGLPDVDVRYVCDPDDQRAANAREQAESIGGHRAKPVSDLRRVLDDRSVDAVVVATPDHWHGPATLLALDAGKHVYVEKPCAHNVREGRLMVEAARRQNRVVQVGTQSRSDPMLQSAVARLREGAIGEVLIAKAWNSQKRSDIGRAQPADPPAGFDYDLWLGPAPKVPFQANRHHYSWHWWYDFGTGDMGNDGVHELDIARWGLGVDEHPRQVTATGGKFFFDDDQQFPDTQYVVFDYGSGDRVGKRRQLVFEMRIWSPYKQDGFDNGNAFYGTEGMLVLGKGAEWKIYGPKNQLLESQQSDRQERDGRHLVNFLESVRTGSRPNADIEIGHLSAALCHLGNIATRVGRPLNLDAQAEQIAGDDEANRLLGRSYRDDHWAKPAGV